MSVFQGNSAERVVYLVDESGPVVGLTEGDVSLRFKKNGEDFQDKTLTPVNFIEREVGFYSVMFDSLEMNALGQFVFRITGGSIIPYVQMFEIVPVYLGAITPPDVCIISGNILDLGGRPLWNSRITFRITDLPKVIEPSMVSGDAVRTVTDHAGNFSASLIRGATVLVEIPDTAIRIQFIVPNQETANIIDLIPS
jgi:hypothetical protein